MNRGGRGKHRGGRAPGGERSQELINGYAVSYVPRLVKCGKANCKKCAAADGGHGPYWYKVYRTAAGRVKTEYYGKQAPGEEIAKVPPKPKKAVKLSELIAETLKQTGDTSTYYIVSRGTYRPVPDDAFVALEEGTDETHFQNYRLTKKDLQIAALIDNDDPDYIILPDTYMIDRHEMLLAFIETVEDEAIYNQLHLAYKQADFLKSYFAILTEENLLQSWFKFRGNHYREVALHWCRKHNLAWRD